MHKPESKEQELELLVYDTCPVFSARFEVMDEENYVSLIICACIPSCIGMESIKRLESEHLCLYTLTFCQSNLSADPIAKCDLCMKGFGARLQSDATHISYQPK